MADKKNTRSEPQAPSHAARRFPSVAVLAAIGILSGGAGFAAPYVATKLWHTPPKAEETDQAQATSKLPRPGEEVAFLNFDPITVNLNDPRLSRYLRLKLTVQVEQKHLEEITKALEQHKVILKDWLLRYLSDKSMDDIRGTAGQNRLRREILDQFNTVLFPNGYDRIHDVLFEEFNVQ